MRLIKHQKRTAFLHFRNTTNHKNTSEMLKKMQHLYSVSTFFSVYEMHLKHFVCRNHLYCTRASHPRPFFARKLRKFSENSLLKFFLDLSKFGLSKGNSNFKQNWTQDQDLMFISVVQPNGTDCANITGGTDGYYYIQPDPTKQPFMVYCDMTNGKFTLVWNFYPLHTPGKYPTVCLPCTHPVSTSLSVYPAHTR